MAISKKIREQVYNKLQGHCGYCGKEIKMKDLQVDHMTPQYMAIYKTVLFENEERTVRDVDHIDNLMPSCRRCNHYKRSDTVEMFRNKMKTLHERLVKSYITRVAQDFNMLAITPFDGKFYFERKLAPTVQ